MVGVEGSVANASPVAVSMTAKFRRCLNKGLPENPKMKGSMVIKAAIGRNGEVLSATQTATGGLSAGVIACVMAYMAAAEFAPPDGGSAKVTIPVLLEPL